MRYPHHPGRMEHPTAATQAPALWGEQPEAAALSGADPAAEHGAAGAGRASAAKGAMDRADGGEAMSNASNRRLLRLPEVKEKGGLSRTAIYKLIAEGQFPRQVCIGPRTVAWCQDDLEAWIEQRIQSEVQQPSGR